MLQPAITIHEYDMTRRLVQIKDTTALLYLWVYTHKHTQTQSAARRSTVRAHAVIVKSRSPSADCLSLMAWRNRSWLESRERDTIRFFAL